MKVFIPLILVLAGSALSIQYAFLLRYHNGKTAGKSPKGA